MGAVRPIPAELLVEFAAFAGLILFAAWPWLRGQSRVQLGVHLGLVPTFLFLPYWLGYAQFSGTSAGPTGGILYPWVIALSRGLRDLPWAGTDTAIVRLFPRPLEPLSQTPGPMLSLSGFGAVGPLTTATLGVTVFAAVVYGPRVAGWLSRVRPGAGGGNRATTGGPRQAG